MHSSLELLLRPASDWRSLPVGATFAYSVCAHVCLLVCLGFGTGAFAGINGEDKPRSSISFEFWPVNRQAGDVSKSIPVPEIPFRAPLTNRLHSPQENAIPKRVEALTFNHSALAGAKWKHAPSNPAEKLGSLIISDSKHDEQGSLAVLDRASKLSVVAPQAENSTREQASDVSALPLVGINESYLNGAGAEYVGASVQASNQANAKSPRRLLGQDGIITAYRPIIVSGSFDAPHCHPCTIVPPVSSLWTLAESYQSAWLYDYGFRLNEQGCLTMVPFDYATRQLNQNCWRAEPQSPFWPSSNTTIKANVTLDSSIYTGPSVELGQFLNTYRLSRTLSTWR